jgi:hypothetical protein
MSRSSRRIVVTVAHAIAMVVVWTVLASAQTTATVTGTVRDTSGGIIPGATVTLISEGRGTSLETTSTATGEFLFSNVTADTYTIRVVMDGFKTLERKGVAVSPGDRAVLGNLAIEVGGLEETITVSGAAPMIQTQTGERSFTISKEAVAELPAVGRNFASFATLAPGVITGSVNASTGSVTFSRLGGGTTNYLLDGLVNVDPGGNGQGLPLNLDAISEVKVLTSAYQAEYGRTMGLQVSGVTKSGTNAFHGSAYDLERRSGWNQNTWANQQNGVAKPLLKERDWGYSIGGPIGKPGGTNKWFFFYSQQISPRNTGGDHAYFRVPTLLERQGDFSQSTDNTGKLYNLIRDASTGLPCTAANTSGCFQDGGVLGRIPQDRLYGLGLNILKSMPLPNANGLNYNLETIAPADSRYKWQPVVRVDYQASGKVRLMAKIAGQGETSKPRPGSNRPGGQPVIAIPGYNDVYQKKNGIIAPSATVDFTLNSTTVAEFNWGMNWDTQLNWLPFSPVTDRRTVGLANFPFLYPNALTVDTSLWDYRTMVATKVPFLDGNYMWLAPSYQWGSRITNPPPNNEYKNNIDFVRTQNVATSITKLMSRHTVKAGFQWDHMLKVQVYGASGSVPFQGLLNFGNDSNNPLDSGFGYANAALGIFSSYSQQSKFIEGNFVYDSIEAYLQDNWRINDKLTLDYGLRLVHQGPNYDTRQQASNFFPDKWSAADAPVLYVPGCSVATTPCPVANKVAVNPQTGGSLGANTAGLVGTYVPNTGKLLNGIIQAGQGIAKTNYVYPALIVTPRIGAAYDVTGNQKLVVRGSVGLFLDRVSGQPSFSQIGNPPNGLIGTLQYSTLQSIPSTGITTVAPPLLAAIWYDSNPPAAWMWNGGVQMALPWSSALDVSYVGTHGYNVIAYGSTSTAAIVSALDLNAPDLGAAYLPQNQDPTLGTSAIPGASAVKTDLMRPYRGLGTIFSTWGRFWTQYDSVQTTFTRRMSRGVQAGVNYTYSIRSSGNTSSPLHFVHDATGKLSTDPRQAGLDAVLADTGNRPHIVKANFVWSLPRLKASNVIAAVLNDWQVSGVLTAGSEIRYDAGYSYQANGANVNLTGSPTYYARIKIPGNAGSGCSSNQYAQLNASAYSGPGYNSIGDESGANLLGYCSNHTFDLAISRSFRLGGSRVAQFRLDAFNLFNSVIYSAANLTMQLNNPAAPTTITNNQYLADGTLNPARVLPKDSGFGAATAAMPMRSVQMQLRFLF